MCPIYYKLFFDSKMRFLLHLKIAAVSRMQKRVKFNNFMLNSQKIQVRWYAHFIII